MNHDQAELTAVQSTTDAAPALLNEVHALAMPDMIIEGRRAAAALRMAETFVVACQEDYELAAEELQAVKSKMTALEAKRETVSGPLHKAWKAFNAMFKAPMDALKDAESKLKNAMLTYSAEQERLAAEARRQAEKQAAEEKARVEAEARRIEQEATAERQRLAKIEADRVVAAQAEQNRLASEAAAAAAAGNAAATAEADRLANEAFERDELAAAQAREVAEQAEQAAQAETAALRMAAAVTSAPVVRIAPTKASGISTVKTVDYEVTNLHALIKHIAENPSLINLVMVDSTKLRAYVRGLGLNTNLPGVSVFEKKTLSARAA